MALIASVQTSFGSFGIVEEGEAITQLLWNAPEAAGRSPLLEEAKAQIRAYCAGELERFDLPLRPSGSAAQQSVWAAMQAIPKGTTRSYGDLAAELELPAQLVGQCCGANPIPVIIPCHRIVGADGLGGFSGMGGVETKVALLRHESAYSLLL
ncbi:MAG: methylated-DNA--[protein]-cysteine S-methyltransferase [Pseudomonadota bacterium]